ncbi:hypothetical protein AAZX31_09G116400 [Glycine max]|uniref:adenine phosphoribosyltransferase n=2 Tax=Glycine subgen. Soja TaxID=1462606 RepID=K7LDJ0_SOYBN|nr:adenine phosphoribosyltransferase 1, chloroplastic [Glycine max]XP_028179745.1 adenine phosphoribosyltransferase 1, chloroplastic-like [Glycine soja]KAG4991420.1 hypothetical protein JHK87_024877 [Glycine soja]KAG5007005.1 hypothetical protein JHK85_025547 [Glycine max]KAG5012795.1 hypothetical protein JHK86_025056 [Glycine max]KAG5133747.1 hypothetical protein JHK82_024935 [Glycine max]KAH1042762.1 hypothetical protein GYH30_024871 [Glycine max]|eukprot:XP_014617600.1 adenine phosphoribosyltransferase 1, chloroplastic [Glycine max]
MVLCLGEVISQKYALEYGTACLELHVGSVQPGERAIIIDDLVATDGTLSARNVLVLKWWNVLVSLVCLMSRGSAGVLESHFMFLLSRVKRINVTELRLSYTKYFTT